MTARNNHHAAKILSALVIIGALVFCIYQHPARPSAQHEQRRFARVHHLQDGGYCYNDGQNWWYYNIIFGDSGGVYSPAASTWVQSARSPADNNLQISAARDASNPEEVEITSQGQPEHEAMTEVETAELESQVSDMVSEGNPNSQDTAETDGGAADAGGGGDSGGDSGGGDGGGGDGGGD